MLFFREGKEEIEEKGNHFLKIRKKKWKYLFFFWKKKNEYSTKTKNTNFSIKMSKPIPLADKTIPHQVSNPLQNVQNQVSSNTSAINSMQNSLQQTSITLSYNTNNITLLNPSEVDTVDQIKNYILQVSNVELNYIGTPN